jgi:exopolyphosphatase/guanosine-5'-triphosphate,3'-diphosphate pyrophosphatase
MNMVRRVAVVDTGTNSTRLAVADIEEGRLTEIARKTEITRLGEDVPRTGRLKPEAMERVRLCFEGYLKITSYLEVDDAVILATSSVRDAADGEEFIAALAKRGSYEYRILTGEQEAALSFAGASVGMPAGFSMTLLDVGGGSTEFASGTGGEADYAVSLNLGCVRLTEKYLRGDPPTTDELNMAESYVRKKISDEVEEDRVRGADRLLAVAGTATSLAMVDLQLPEYDRSIVDGHVLKTDRVKEMAEELAALTAQQRHVFNLPPGRADVIVGGAIILYNAALHCGSDEIHVSEKDILDGAAISLAAGNL